MDKNIFIILGNQLFDPKLLRSKGCDEVFMSEDFGLCTFIKHHKLKLYLININTWKKCYYDRNFTFYNTSNRNISYLSSISK